MTRRGRARKERKKLHVKCSLCHSLLLLCDTLLKAAVNKNLLQVQMSERLHGFYSNLQVKHFLRKSFFFHLTSGRVNAAPWRFQHTDVFLSEHWLQFGKRGVRLWHSTFQGPSAALTDLSPVFHSLNDAWLTLNFTTTLSCCFVRHKYPTKCCFLCPFLSFLHF